MNPEELQATLSSCSDKEIGEMVIFKLAGVYAEAHAFHNNVVYDGTDRQIAIELIAVLTLRKDPFATLQEQCEADHAIVDELENETQKRIATHWKQIRHLAHELFNSATVDGTRIRKIAVGIPKPEN